MRLGVLLGLIAALGISASSQAQTPTAAPVPPREPPPPTGAVAPPSPLPRLAPEIAARFQNSTAAYVYEVDDTASSNCTPHALPLEDTVLCHRTRSSTPAPGGLWISEMASLLSRATVYPRSRIFRAGIAVRFIERDLVTDALLALDDHRVLIAVWDGSPMEIQPDASRLTLLQLIGRALPGSPRVRAAIAEEQTRLAQEEANRIRARKKDPVEPL